jgi:hypothetical protein
MTRYNNLNIEVFEPQSTTKVPDERGDLNRAVVERIQTMYPGGIYGAATIYVPRDAMRPWSMLKPNSYRVRITNGSVVVYEGYIDDQVYIFGGQGGVRLNLVGAWGIFGPRRAVRRYWADNRISEDAWSWYTPSASAEKASPDRNNRLRITPKNQAWGLNTGANFRYLMPYGENIYRITFDYNLTTVNGEDWTIAIVNGTSGAFEWSVSRTTNGTTSGSATVNLAATTDFIYFRLRSDLAQTPAANANGDFSFGEISNVRVFARTGAFSYAETASAVMGDIPYLANQQYSTLKIDTRKISTNTYNISPFITGRGGYEKLSDVMTRLAGFGDGSYNPWAAGFVEADPGDYLPIVYYEQQPALTGYDYQLFVRGRGEQQTPIQLRRSFEHLRNWIVVRFTDETGQRQEIDSFIDANLWDIDNSNRFLRRDVILDIGQSTQAQAQQYGVQYMHALTRTSYFRLDSPVEVRGYIIGKNGNRVPASEIKSGKRVRLMDFANYVPYVNESGVTFVISSTEYDDRTQSCRLTTGKPGPLTVMAAQAEHQRRAG